MKILIIGKTGQVGLSLITEARLNHIDFVATGREELNITDQHAINNFFDQTHDFDFIINAAAYTNVDGAETDIESANAVNCLVVKYLAFAAKKYEIPLIHISTDYVFDGEKATGYNEDDDTNPLGVYGKTKLDGEKCLKDIWKKHIILRVSWVVSEHGKNFLKTIANLCDKKEMLSVVCDQFGSPTSAHSIAETIIAICAKLHAENNNEKYFGTYHYTDFPATSWHQLASHVLTVKKNTLCKEIKPIESKDFPTPTKRPKNSILNTHKIKKVFGIEQKLWTTEVDRIINNL